MAMNGFLMLLRDETDDANVTTYLKRMQQLDMLEVAFKQALKLRRKELMVAEAKKMIAESNLKADAPIWVPFGLRRPIHRHRHANRIEMPNGTLLGLHAQ